MGGRNSIDVKRLCLEEFPFFAEQVLRIRAKDGSVIPFVLNEAQRYLHQQIEQQRERTGHVRVIGVKGRQQGFSSYVQGRFFWRILPSRGLRSFILTHDQEATNNLFEIAERFCNEAPFAVEPDRSNAKELHFTDQDSGYRVGTAGNKAVGRSSTLQLFHGSEVAYWPNADAHKAGILQAVPDLPGTEIILESTANGIGGTFYDMWNDAVAKKNEYLPIFIPWYWQNEYRRPVFSGFKRTKTENQLVRQYGLDNEQLCWRRSKIGELKPSEGGDPEDLFKQEYPCDPTDAFLFSGRVFFSPSRLISALDECFSPDYKAEIQFMGGINKRPDGRLSVWEKPKRGTYYVIGADVAEGLERGDYSCADVLALPDGRQVAQWHGHIDPDLFGEALYALGYYYNKALVGVERNNHGLTTLTTMRNKGYPFIYAQEDIERRSEGHQFKRMGWLTTLKSKIKICDQLAAEVRDDEHRICCHETIREMQHFIIYEDGSLGAKEGLYDDRVIARAIAGEMVLASPKSRRRQKTSGFDTSSIRAAAGRRRSQNIGDPG